MQIKKLLKKHIALILAVCFLLAGLLTEFISVRSYMSIPEQYFALGYGTDVPYAQVSLFASDGAGFTVNSIPAIRGGISKRLADNTDVSAVLGRPFIDTYSAKDTIRFKSDKSAADLETIGVGGDFFMIHPHEIVSGTFFSEDTDENGDGLVLNESAAWQLFGGTDVAGLYVRAGDMELCIRGVVREADSAFAKEAGHDEARAYIAFDALEDMAGGNDSYSGDSLSRGGSVDITCYELLMINPVKDFAYEALYDGVKTANLNEDHIVRIENTGRFSYFNRIRLLKSFFTRVMDKADIVFPYWENSARAAEQLLMLLVAFELLFFAAAFITLIIGLVGLSDEFRRFSAFIRGRIGALREFIVSIQRKMLEKKAGRGKG